MGFGGSLYRHAGHPVCAQSAADVDVDVDLDVDEPTVPASPANTGLLVIRRRMNHVPMRLGRMTDAKLR